MINLRTSLYAAAAAVALVAVSPAMATTIILDSNGNGSFSGSHVGSPAGTSFTDNFDFATSFDGQGIVQFGEAVLTINYLDVSSITFNGVSATPTLLPGSTNTWQAVIQAPLIRTPGSNTISVTGTTVNNGGLYSGTIQVAAGVPEPASWAMMVGGFGLLGGALRRKRNLAVSFG